MTGLAHDFRYSVRQLQTDSSIYRCRCPYFGFWHRCHNGFVQHLRRSIYPFCSDKEQGNRNTLITQKFTKGGTQTSHFRRLSISTLMLFPDPLKVFWRYGILELH